MRYLSSRSIWACVLPSAGEAAPPSSSTDLRSVLDEVDSCDRTFSTGCAVLVPALVSSWCTSLAGEGEAMVESGCLLIAADAGQRAGEMGESEEEGKGEVAQGGADERLSSASMTRWKSARASQALSASKRGEQTRKAPPNEPRGRVFPRSAGPGAGFSADALGPPRPTAAERRYQGKWQEQRSFELRGEERARSAKPSRRGGGRPLEVRLARAPSQLGRLEPARAQPAQLL